MKGQESQEKNKRTSLVPIIKNKKSKKDTKKNNIKMLNSNIPKEYNKDEHKNNNQDINNYNNHHFDKDIEYIKNVSNKDNKNNILEKVTIKNTTTKSIETRTPDGHYTNATQSDESVKEYTRYESINNEEKRLYDEYVDIYPSDVYDNNKKYEQPKSMNKGLIEEDKKLKMISKSEEPLLLNEINKQTMDKCIELVKENGLAIQFIEPKYRNKMIEILAVKENGLALKYIDTKHQNESLCLEAVKQNGLSLKYVKIQTTNICKEAIRENWLAFHYVLDKHYDICLEAVRNNGLLLQYMKSQDERLCREAVEQNPSALEFVLNQTDDLCRKALYTSGLSLKYIKEKTPELCILALHKNSLAIRYIPVNILKQGLDLKDYVFIYSKKHVLVNSIKEVRGLRQVYLPTNENGYLIINAVSNSKYKTSFILEKDDVYIDKYLIDELVSNKHFVALINE